MTARERNRQPRGRPGFNRGLQVCAVLLAVCRPGALPADDRSRPAQLCARATGAVTIDGRLDAAEWGGAAPASGFLAEPDAAFSPVQTVASAMWDDRHLYVGLVVAESDMQGVVTKYRGYDAPVWRDDSIEVFVDPGHSHTLHYQFIVNAAGATADGRARTILWNGSWSAAVERMEDRWTVEMAIPFSTTEAGVPAPGDIWGVNYGRKRHAAPALSTWSETTGDHHRTWDFGHLCFVEDAAAWSSLDLPELARRSGPPTRLFVPDGIVYIGASTDPVHLTYDADVERRLAAVEQWRQKLRALSSDGAVDVEAFRRIEQDWADVVKAATPGAHLSCMAWAGRVAGLPELTGRMEGMWWEGRLNLLYEEIAR